MVPQGRRRVGRTAGTAGGALEEQVRGCAGPSALGSSPSIWSRSRLPPTEPELERRRRGGESKVGEERGRGRSERRRGAQIQRARSASRLCAVAVEGAAVERATERGAERAVCARGEEKR